MRSKCASEVFVFAPTVGSASFQEEQQLNAYILLYGSMHHHSMVNLVHSVLDDKNVIVNECYWEWPEKRRAGTTTMYDSG